MLRSIGPHGATRAGVGLSGRGEPQASASATPALLPRVSRFPKRRNRPTGPPRRRRLFLPYSCPQLRFVANGSASTEAAPNFNTDFATPRGGPSLARKPLRRLCHCSRRNFEVARETFQALRHSRFGKPQRGIRAVLAAEPPSAWNAGVGNPCCGIRAPGFAAKQIIRRLPARGGWLPIPRADDRRILRFEPKPLRLRRFRQASRLIPRQRSSYPRLEWNKCHNPLIGRNAQDVFAAIFRQVDSIGAQQSMQTACRVIPHRLGQAAGGASSRHAVRFEAKPLTSLLSHLAHRPFGRRGLRSHCPSACPSSPGKRAF